MKQRHPAADVVGLDPDVDALERARRKAARAAVAVQLDRGFADQLPYPDASVDRVLSSFMLHHVDQAEKPRAMREVRRVLRPGGSLHVVDMAGPRHPEGHGVRLLRRSSRLAENLDDGIPDLLREAGFADVVEGGYSSVFGIRCTFYRAADA